MISHPLRCVYIHVPKTGGHSIDTFFLQRQLVSVGNWHATALQTRKTLGDAAYQSYFSFATVRNPWDRWVSEYVWQKSTSETHIPTPWGRKEITFEEFCRSDFSWYPIKQRIGGHLDDQSHFLYDHQDQLMVNYIVRYEDLQTGFEEVCQRLQLTDAVLPRLNVTNHQPYQTYYTPELVDLVGRRFARDIRLLGYKFE